MNTSNAADSSGGDNWGWDGETDDVEMSTVSSSLKPSEEAAAAVRAQAAVPVQVPVPAQAPGRASELGGNSLGNTRELDVNNASASSASQGLTLGGGGAGGSTPRGARRGRGRGGRGRRSSGAAGGRMQTEAVGIMPAGDDLFAVSYFLR